MCNPTVLFYVKSTTSLLVALLAVERVALALLLSCGFFLLAAFVSDFCMQHAKALRALAPPQRQLSHHYRSSLASPHREVMTVAAGSESNCSIWNAACTLELKYDVRVDSKIVCHFETFLTMCLHMKIDAVHVPVRATSRH